MKVYVEGYGCALNISDTEKIIGLLKKNRFAIVDKPSEADAVIINTCAVKLPTENRMIRRIRELISETNAKILVFGCLTAINPDRIPKNRRVVVVGTKLSELAKLLNLREKNVEFSPELEEVKFNPCVAIVPIARGCLGNCSYCAVKFARGKLQSYAVDSIVRKIRKELKKSREVWLTAEDTACYGFDIGTNLAELLKKILKIRGDYRIRIGMMNVNNLKLFLDEFLDVFEDKRIYKFLHLPVQSGSNRILKLMNRNYTANEFVEVVERIKKKFPEITLSTDVIVGFPTETEEDFKKTVALLKKIRATKVNISRYGVRPNTEAAKMEQIIERTKKERSRKLTKLCRELAFKENKKMVGRIEKILISAKGRDCLIGRTKNYKQVIVKENCKFCEFAKVKIVEARAYYLIGKLVE